MWLSADKTTINVVLEFSGSLCWFVLKFVFFNFGYAVLKFIPVYSLVKPFQTVESSSSGHGGGVP